MLWKARICDVKDDVTDHQRRVTSRDSRRRFEFVSSYAPGYEFKTLCFHPLRRALRDVFPFIRGSRKVRACHNVANVDLVSAVFNRKKEGDGDGYAAIDLDAVDACVRDGADKEGQFIALMRCNWVTEFEKLLAHLPAIEKSSVRALRLRQMCAKHWYHLLRGLSR